MKTIYLDQMKWIDLARAENGHKLGVAFVPALETFKQAADEGRARFVLSAAHYLETGKAQSRKRREELANTMMRLAGMNRIAPPHIIVPWEIRKSFIEVFDLPITLPELQIFGSGASHALALPSAGYTAPREFEGMVLPEHARRKLEEAIIPRFETMILGGIAPDGYPEETRLVLSKITNLDNHFVIEQNRIASWVEKLGRDKLVNMMAATAMGDIMAPMIEASEELGVSMEDVIDARNVFTILEDIPSRWVEMKLRHFRQANPEKSWEGNDLNDITALAIAVPYCDVIVTEKSWSSMLNMAKFPQRYGTLVTRNLDDVVGLLERPQQ